jgi:hypothetical protein
MIRRLHFKYKGDRDYVHGTDIFTEILTLLNKEYDASNDLIDIDMSIHLISRNKMSLYDYVDPSITQKPGVVCNAKCGSHFQKTFYLYENEESVAERYEYTEEQIILKAKYSEDEKSMFTESLGDYSFIENVVALNKGLLQILLTDKPAGKWYFTRIKLRGFNYEFIHKNSLLKVQFKKNMQFRITDSIIFLDNNMIGNIYFSLV